MTPNGDKRKYSITMYETHVHTFTVEATDLKEAGEVAEEMFVQAPVIEELPGYHLTIADRDIDDVQEL